MPFTDQVTPVLEVPETVAVNGNVSPAWILAVGGDTETWTPAGGGGGGCLFVEEVLAAHPAKNKAEATKARVDKTLVFIRRHRKRFIDATSLRD